MRMTGIIGEIGTVAAMASTNAARHLGLREVAALRQGAGRISASLMIKECCSE